ncbi:TadE family protein [Cellulomonas timonensis]|uniref:TadE family protein n=1 Tax=Cellulomonas timonensis TaxID=1689271 RepID=UPI00082963A4|nr:TadE family protein [Cellulomonas timonensis]
MSDGRPDGGAAGRERGAAVVDFVLVGALTSLLFAAVLQLAIIQHVRNTLVDCAAEGARYAALADRSAEDGAERTRALVTAGLSGAYAQDVTVRHTEVNGLEVVEVRITAPMPVAGLLGPARGLTVVGHALDEGDA